MPTTRYTTNPNKICASDCPYSNWNHVRNLFFLLICIYQLKSKVIKDKVKRTHYINGDLLQKKFWRLLIGHALKVSC